MTKGRPYLRSKLRRGRWFHTYRRAGKEVSLGVHGLHPTDPQVFAAYCAEHARWEDRPPETATPDAGTFAWAVDLLMASDGWKRLAPSTRQTRATILRRYVAAQGARPLSSITTEVLEAALHAKGGFAAINELKALRPVFRHAAKLRFIPADPTKGIELDKPKSKGHPTATVAEIARFQKRWPIGTTERLAFDLAILTGAARVDLCRLGRHNICDGVLTYNRQKTGTEANVPVTAELQAVIARTRDIAPTFLLTQYGKPFTDAGLGNYFADAATEARVGFRLHGLRKAFCVFWAEKGHSTHEIAAMAGHTTLAEVARYTRDADRRRMVQQIAQGL